MRKCAFDRPDGKLRRYRFCKNACFAVCLFGLAVRCAFADDPVNSRPARTPPASEAGDPRDWDERNKLSEAQLCFAAAHGIPTDLRHEFGRGTVLELVLVPP